MIMSIEPPHVVNRVKHTENFPDILSRIGSTLLVTSYKSRELIVVGLHEGRLDFGNYHFEWPMGVAARAGRLAIVTRNQVWMMHEAPAIGRHMEPAGRYDSCFLARTSHFTGAIHGHEIAWCGNELWLVNTLFSCLCTMEDDFNFSPRWRPPFISSVVPEDRCHLNGLAVEAGRAKYVTMIGTSDADQGWRPDKATGGCLYDVDRGEPVAGGLTMPHSPRVNGERVWLLNSGCGSVVVVDPVRGSKETVCELPGFTRGLALAGEFAFIGLSTIRETTKLDGVPIAEHRARLKCGVAVVDLRSGRPCALLEFLTGVDEIFDVQLLPGRRNVVISGPHTDPTQQPPIWKIAPYAP
jgi:uncharacterized protein (TIGR03032 family)